MAAAVAARRRLDTGTVSSNTHSAPSNTDCSRDRNRRTPLKDTDPFRYAVLTKIDTNIVNSSTFLLTLIRLIVFAIRNFTHMEFRAYIRISYYSYYISA